jgi:hypothetical protein
MKIRIARPIAVAAIAALTLVAGSIAASAQTCPASPNYTPDFSSNQTCLTPNNNGAGAGYPGFTTAVSGTGTVLRLTPNQFFWAGSAWYNTQQPVAGAFSTTFTFQLTATTPGGSGNADGIAFVIQNSPAGTAALGPDGCGIGFGGDSLIGCTSGSGIANSLAVEFNTYLNSGIDPSNSGVKIQNCSLTGPNSVDPGCTLAMNDLTTLLPTPINLADGNVHRVTINYSGPSTTLLDVILDNNDLFPPTQANPSGGVLFNLASMGLNSGNAWVGVTAATGGGDDNQDILSWTFTPQAQTAVISTTAPATVSFPNASGTNVYSYTAQLTSGTPQTVTFNPILMSQSACDAIVQKSFWPARCFVYQNAENSGLDEAVMFEVTCSSGPCNNFSAELGTGFEFLLSDNPFFTYPGVIGLLNPFPGWLKGEGPDPLHPCTPASTGALFQSNQIDTFFIDNGTTKGKSGGTGSCWTATYDTPFELWPGISISSPAFTTYSPGQTVAANYSCSNPPTSKAATSATGPYITVSSCKQSVGTQNSCTFTPVQSGQKGGLACTGTFVTPATKGMYLFAVTAIDSGSNRNVNAVVYKVK